MLSRILIALLRYPSARRARKARMAAPLLLDPAALDRLAASAARMRGELSPGDPLAGNLERIEQYSERLARLANMQRLIDS